MIRVDAETVAVQTPTGRVLVALPIHRDEVVLAAEYQRVMAVAS